MTAREALQWVAASACISGTLVLLAMAAYIVITIWKGK